MRSTLAPMKPAISIPEFDCVLDCIEQLQKRLISIRKKKKEIFYMKHHR